MSVKTVVTSTNLSAFKLKKGLNDVLKRFDDLCTWSAKAGRAPPTCVRLYRHQYNDINSAIRAQSENQLSIAEVRYKGLPLIAHDQPAKNFALEAS